MKSCYSFCKSNSWETEFLVQPIFSSTTLKHQFSLFLYLCVLVEQKLETTSNKLFLKPHL